MYPTLVVHIVAGLIAILAGYVALATVKGLRAHRSSGRVFVYSMTSMALIGAWIALTHNKAPEGNVPIGLLSTYLVITGLTTVRPPARRARVLDVGMATLASTIALVLFGFGFYAATLPRGVLHGLPTPPFFVIGVVASLAAVGDFRLVRSGGTEHLRGGSRLARHLWRMSFAHLIAAFAFFPRLLKYIPRGYPRVPLVLLPAIVVLIMMLYWLWRVRFRKLIGAPATLRASDRSYA